MPLRPLLALTLLLGLAACAGGDDSYDGIDFKTCGVRPHAVLPVEYRNRVPVVQATIKGQPTSMVLDTGASGMVLTEGALKRLALGTDVNRLFTGQGVGGETKAFAGKLVDFEIDSMHVPDHPVNVLPDNTAMTSHFQIDGLFGGDVLANFEVDLDLPHRRVTLYAGRLCPTTVLPPWSVPYETLDASASANLRFVVPVELDGQKLTALLDTGAAGTVVSAAVARSLGVTTEMLQQGPHTQLVGAGPEAPVAYFHRFHAIRVGDDTYQAPLLLVTERPDPRVDMIIGEDYLIQHHLWLSYATKRVYIERGATPNAGS